MTDNTSFQVTGFEKGKFTGFLTICNSEGCFKVEARFPSNDLISFANHKHFVHFGKEQNFEILMKAEPEARADIARLRERGFFLN